jgi:hypothetical protein
MYVLDTLAEWLLQGLGAPAKIGSPAPSAQRPPVDKMLTPVSVLPWTASPLQHQMTHKDAE